MPDAEKLFAVPFESELLAPWRSHLSRALHRNRAVPFSRYLQLATLKQDKTPANRTVVFRGFLNETNHLIFISDLRSEKTRQVQMQPDAEACWYFTKTREQFRLSGKLTLVTNEEDNSALSKARHQIWQNISDNARIQFTWPHPKKQKEGTTEFEKAALDKEEPAAFFTLLLLTVDSVDHLELRGDPQNRTLYQRNQSDLQAWDMESVNP